MKKYDIFMKIEEYGDEEIINKQFKKSKKIFLSSIKKETDNKKIILAKEQEALNVVSLSIDEEYLDEILDLFRSIAVVSEIDAEYTDPKE